MINGGGGGGPTFQYTHKHAGFGYNIQWTNLEMEGAYHAFMPITYANSFMLSHNRPQPPRGVVRFLQLFKSCCQVERH